MKPRILKNAFAAAFLTLALIGVATTGYAQKHESLTPLLIDQEGWTADTAEGMSMDMGAMKMVTASRTYAQGEKEIDVVIMIGNQAMTQGKMQEMKMESSDGSVTTSEIDGFQVQTIYDKKGDSSSLVVYLAQSPTAGALLVICGEGLSEKEMLSMAKKFDWKAMKAAAEKLF